MHQRGKARGYDESVTQPRKPSPTESPLLFELDDEPLQETLTAWGGVPLAVQEFRSLGVSARVRQHVHIKQRERGYDAATTVESFVVLNALGGDRMDDFAHLGGCRSRSRLFRKRMRTGRSCAGSGSHRGAAHSADQLCG